MPDSPSALVGTAAMLSTLTAIRGRLGRFLRATDGPTAVEYAVMLAAILLVCLAAVQIFGSATASSFGDTNSKIAPHMTGS